MTLRTKVNWKVLGTSTALLFAGYHVVGQRRQAKLREHVVDNQQVFSNLKNFQWHDIPRFYRDVYTPPYPHEGASWWYIGRVLVIGAVGIVSKCLTQGMEHTRVIHMDKFLAMLHDPHRNRGIITVSNHLSVWDDPVLWGVFPLTTLFDVEKMRWVLGAADICYTNILKSTFFTCGQAIPTVRGAGIYQPAVDYAIARLHAGSWIHVFPEGKVNQTGSMIRFKWGIGRMIMESEPIVVPVWIHGMDRVRPLVGPFARFGQKVTMVFGDPIDYRPILDAWRRGDISVREARIQLTQLTKDSLAEMQEHYGARLDEL
ncbi:acyltransferase-domain-containing protein [Gongronella butleri]|nr:acyltransferase-domain-containing protein [Gongronella butleri]